MHSGRPRLLAVGALCTTTVFQVDNIPPAPAKTLASNMLQLVDGMAISAAFAFMKLGGEAAVWARTGDDSAGLAAREALRAEGLDVDGLRAVHGSRSSLATVIVDGQGERLVVPYHDPALDPSAAWFPLDKLNQYGLVHCDVRWQEGAATVMRAALARGIPTMLDGDVGPVPVLQSLVPLATYAVFSDAGLKAYTGLDDVEAGLRAVEAEAHELPVALKARRHVGASCGAAGYVWLEPPAGESGLKEAMRPQPSQLRHVPAPAVEVVDTLSAGDVFHGAFALAMLQGQDIARAARFACVAASLKCTRFGGRLGCPDLAEVFLALRGGAPAGA